MAKKESDYGDAPVEEKSAPAPWPTGALTIDLVQRMIDAAFIRYNIEHGHLGADDGARMLEDLKKS